MFLRYSMWSILKKDIIKVKVVGSLYIHRLLHGKMKIKIDFFRLHSVAAGSETH